MTDRLITEHKPALHLILTFLPSLSLHVISIIVTTFAFNWDSIDNGQCETVVAMIT